MPLDPKAVAFFFEHAGYSHAPDETPEAGKIRGALSLARAERHATRKGWYVEWADDWEVGSHVAGAPEAYDVEPDTCEIATLYNRHRHMLGSLGCVDNASDDYRRVVAAELASEAIAERVARKVARSAGFVCKQCGGPSPVGVGYVDITDGAAARSAGVTVCRCGHSVHAQATLPPVPPDFPVQPLTPDQAGLATDPATCGECGRTWDDAVSTGMTPVPSGRCPFEHFHSA